MNLLHDLIKSLSPPLQRIAAQACSFLLGLALAVLLNYVLYRLGLPSKPFIYVAF
jgi:hypothetical protein